MKSMKELVLDRLMQQYQGQVDEARQALNEREVRLAAMHTECVRVTEMLRGFREGEAPIRNLYEAAEKVYSAKTPAARRKAISHLGSALLVAEKHVDTIPF